MKRQHTYEQLINQKLNGLVAPDVTGLWNDMEAILDQEMPRQNEKKRRIGAWWVNANLLVAASLFLAVGSVYTLCQVAGKQRTVSANELSAERTNAEKGSLAVTPLQTKTAGDALASTGVVSVENNNHAQPKKRLAASGFQTVTAVAGPVASQENTQQPAANGETPVVNDNVVLTDAASAETTVTTAIAAEDATAVMAEKTTEAIADLTAAVEGVDVSKTAFPAVFDRQEVKTLGSVGVAKKAKRTKIYVDKGLSAGLSLNAPVALNNQVRNSLDMKGQKNQVQDYMPSVYAQLHLSKNFYVQAEWQPVAAQYTPNFTLYNRVDVLNPDEKEQKVVKLNKLFYSNVPVSFHYKTPVKNLTVGVGVQYSKLKKVVLQDQEYYHLIQAGGVFKVDTRKDEAVVKDPEDIRSHNTGDVVDSVARSFRREDWRLLADVGYHYKGFNLGVRYTTGVGNYINSNFTNLSVKDRNQALQLYLRFNLFDSRKK